MADLQPQFQYTFEAPETKPGHLIALPKDQWFAFHIRNAAEQVGNKPLNYKGLDPNYVGLHTVSSVWYCEAVPETLPTIDQQIQAQWEAQGYTVAWNRDVVLNFNLMLAQVDDKDNIIRVVPDNRQSFSNKANTMRMETVGLWNKIGVPYGDIPVVDANGNKTMQRQYNISGMVSGHFFGKMGEPFVSDDGRVTQKIADYMSVEQWKASNAPSQPAPAASQAPQAMNVESSVAAAQPAQPPTASAPISTGQNASPQAAPPTQTTGNGEAKAPANDIFKQMLGA